MAAHPATQGERPPSHTRRQGNAPIGRSGTCLSHLHNRRYSSPIFMMTGFCLIIRQWRQTQPRYSGRNTPKYIANTRTSTRPPDQMSPDEIATTHANSHRPTCRYTASCGRTSIASVRSPATNRPHQTRPLQDTEGLQSDSTAGLQPVPKSTTYQHLPTTMTFRK